MCIRDSYLSVDRYDIQYVVRLLAQKISEPNKHDWLRLRHVVKYLLGTADWVWSFPFQGRSEELQAQSDSDWRQDAKTRKRVSSGFLRNGQHVWEHWCSGQQLVALSSGEAEFYAAGKAATHGLFFLYLLAEFGRKLRLKVRMDSSAARGIFGRQGPGRIRHLATRWLWVQERVRRK